MKKYTLTTTTKQCNNVTLYQIKADRDFGSISKGDLGGYIEKEENLSHNGDAWVSGNARVFGDAWVFGDAQVSGDARVSGNARIYAKAYFTKGWFMGGDDSGKITDITNKTGATFWKNQYVLGDYEITPIEEEKTLSGTEVSVTIGDKIYKAIIK